MEEGRFAWRKLTPCEGLYVFSIPAKLGAPDPLLEFGSRVRLSLQFMCCRIGEVQWKDERQSERHGVGGGVMRRGKGMRRASRAREASMVTISARASFACAGLYELQLANVSRKLGHRSSSSLIGPPLGHSDRPCICRCFLPTQQYIIIICL